MADQKIEITIKDTNNSIGKLSDIVDILYPGRPTEIGKMAWAQKSESILLKDKWRNAYIQYKTLENLSSIDTSIDVEG